MTRVIARTPGALGVTWVQVDGVVRENVIEASSCEGWIIRYATEEEVERLVTKPGLIWPRDQDVLIQEWGEVSIGLEG